MGYKPANRTIFDACARRKVRKNIRETFKWVQYQLEAIKFLKYLACNKKKHFPASSESMQIDRAQRISREKSSVSPTNLGCKSGGQVCNFDEEKKPEIKKFSCK
jgi:hypothetical protein